MYAGNEDVDKLSDDLRLLHSFPTRRSSDLQPMNEMRGRLLVDGKLLTGTLGWDGGRITRVATEGEIGGADLPPDRKSTRLNSSHVEISYAVFCLKKKIVEERMHHGCWPLGR